MEGTALRGFQVSKSLQMAVVVSIFVGLAFLSNGAASSDAAVANQEKTDFAVATLTTEQSEVTLECPNQSTLYPKTDSKKFCRDAACTQERTFQEAFVSVSWVNGTGQEHTEDREKPNGNTLTLDKYPILSTTLYFQCRNEKNDQEQEQKVVSEEDETPKVSRVIQVAVYGGRAATTINKEKECGDDETVKLDVTTRAVTFRCASDATVLPINFERVFQGDNCEQEVDLKTLVPSASLVEGMSATSPGNAVPWSMAELPTFTPAYTFAFLLLPDSEKKLCYKCSPPKTPEATAEAVRQPKECLVRITVSGKQTGPDTPTCPEEGEERPILPEQQGGNGHSDQENQEDSHSGSNEPGGQGDNSNSDKPHQKPGESQTPTGSSSRKTTTSGWMLAIITVFSTFVTISSNSD
ncbi:SAG-related sequence SRS55N [Toxoplasma gondii ARI]|uniref:SAG-related sequence SRS55N n=1 Tax=Toxoplasma gondii ARI TaxID=1074872 RepID=A0A139Y7F6_TOXGO|nr:SAG-related sequence SRS55N [Toxoplasma gondii ARI]